MYSRGSNPYGQLYGAQQSYGQNPGTSHSSLLSSAQDPEIGGFRPATSSQYGGQYGDVYGSSTLTSVQQVGSMSVKVSGSSSLQGRAGYASAMPESPKFGSGECASLSSLGYGKIGDPFSGEVPDYFSVERRNYSEHQNAYAGRDLQSEAARRYAESVGLSHQRQPELYDHLEQASLLRQQQMLKSQSLQTTSLEGGARQVDYLAARGAAILHATQDLASYGGRMDADPRNLSMLTGPSYGAQHQGSILGAAPLRNVDDLIYAQGSSSAGYGVSLPPGRDYAAAGKGLRGTSLDTDYPGSLLSRGGHSSVVGSRIDERKDDRGGYRRELEVRDEERRREHLHEREKEREREREKERERERERARERGRLLERRNKERERKRALETRRERTPPRVARDRQVSSTREEKSSKRDSPRHESLHRRHSPVREKRREYICKVYPSCLVEVERDYLSISKRYPKLSISPEFSKVVLNWPKHNLNISLHTPVSFEHVLVEIESKAEHKEAPTERLAEESEQSRNQNTVWNAKVILMSGISSDALYDLSSDKIFDERIPHINNILRFAFLRKDRSFMAIGGRWDGVDGGDPSVDDSSLVHTALRHVKDLVQLDLCNCQHWNRFLEIHYDRVGKDGLFSHREITVLFIPDLSQCLPSLNDWRDQWLAHRKATSDRERHLASQKEKKPVEKDNVVKGDKTHSKPDKDGDSARTTKGKKDPHGSQSSQAVDGKKAGEDGVDIQGDSAENQKGKDEGADVKGQSIVINKEQEPVAHVTEVQKPGKKKIVRKVVKQKAACKKAGGDSGVSKEKDKLDVEDVADKESKTEIAVQQDGAKVDLNVGSAGKKKIVKKVVAKSALKQVQEDDSKDNVDNNSASATQGTVSKTIKKKKIIKKVPKKKITGVEDVGASADIKDDDKDENKADSLVTNEKIIDTGKKTISNKDSKMIPAEKHGDDADMIKIKDEKGKKEGKGDDDKKEISSKTETDATKGKSSSKDGDGKLEKEKKGKYEKDEPRRKASKDVKEKGKSDEPPKHPGLILQTKQTKESKVRSTTLSLDSLLDYTDKDIEESTFELSLFAEAVYEMLQFQMGCRLLAFLEKLRLHFVNKRNQRKRQRDENPQKESEKEKSSRKRLKTTAELPMKSTSVKSETQDDAEPDNEETVAKDPKNEETVAKEETSVDGGDESSMDNEGDDYDPEEYEDEDQEMDDASHENDASKEAGPEDAKPKEENDQKDEKKEGVKRNKDENKTAEMGLTNMQKSKEKDADLGTEEEEKPPTKERTIDKELLQAFRFFDRNRVGYIKVEDLRLIIHNLGKFLSHRDVKELVQSALLESNTARDNRILYNKLVRQ